MNTYNSISITGFGLLLRIYANAIPLLFPNIIIVTICIFISSASCGICYMPIILEIWKYFPDNKGLTTSLALSGFGFTQLIFEDISINIINYEKNNIDYLEGVYSFYTNDNFKEYLGIFPPEYHARPWSNYEEMKIFLKKIGKPFDFDYFYFAHKYPTIRHFLGRYKPINDKINFIEDWWFFARKSKYYVENSTIFAQAFSF